MEENQFDTIYHEHFSYFSFSTAKKIFDFHGITLFDVEELPTHGGSLRIYGKHRDDDSNPVSGRVTELLEREMKAGVLHLDFYKSFEEQVKETKRKLLEFLMAAKRKGKKIAGYGAPGKGNTLLNYCGYVQILLTSQLTGALTNKVSYYPAHVYPSILLKELMN